MTLPFDTKVNGTLVKSGTYDVVFEEESGQLTILKRGKVIATVAAQLEKRDRKAKKAEARTITAGAENELIGVTFEGSDQNVVVKSMSMQMGMSK